MTSQKISPIETLVLATTIALALGILAPSRFVAGEAEKLKKCSANLRGLGQAHYIYAQDSDYFVVSGHLRPDNNGAMVLFAKETRDKAPATDAAPSPTVDLWRLLRDNNSTAKQFVCPLTKDKPDPDEDITKHYNFLGPENLSYAYQYQYDSDRPPLGTGSDPSFPLMADSNPYIKGGIKETAMQDRLSPSYGNSLNHDEERISQNVLFVDGHVTLLKRPDTGLRVPMDKANFRRDRGLDNIYTVHEKNKPGDPGEAPTSTKCNLGSKSDCCLVP